MTEQMITGLIFIGIGGVFILVALISLYRTRRFVEESVPALGEVIGLHERRGDDVTYSPVIRFPVPGGGVVEFTETTSSYPAGYQVGDRVRVLYHREDLRRARVASTWRLYMLAMISGLLGGIFFVVGLLVTAFG
jgi:hypothetical protein